MAIHGLGGVGKTRVAIEYALRQEAEYSALLVATADSPGALQRNLAALCGPLVLNLPEQAAKEEYARVAAALRWLGGHPGWLLILDTVDTPKAAEAVEDLLPQLQEGQVLITSRLSDWSGGVQPLELDVLGEDASMAFLRERTEGRRRVTPTDEADARALAKELDGLALALEQSGAFIWQKRTSFSDYLSRWREREAKVRDWHDERLMKYPRSVAVTWDITFEQLDAPARVLLRLLCWLAPEPVPRALLRTDTAKQTLARGVELLRTSGELPQADPEMADMEDAPAALAAFSLIRWESGNEAFRIHRLVQEVTRERLAADHRESWLQSALALVNDYLPGDPPPDDIRSWPRWEPVRTHVAAVIAAADAAGIGNPTSRLATGLGLLLMAKYVWPEAEALMRRALAIDEKSFGPDHPEVARDLNNLAWLLQDTNRLAEAEPPMRRVLEILLRFMAATGHEHPHLRTTIRNYAWLLEQMGRNPEEVQAQFNALARPFGLQIGE